MKGQVVFELHQKWCWFYFSWQLRKRHHFGAANSWPSYFVRALVFMRFDLKVQKNSREIFQVQFFSSKLKDSIYEKYRKKLC